MTDRATGSLIGERREVLTTPASGVYNLSATGNARGDWPVAEGYWPYNDGTFPISNAQMQWMFQADGFPSGGISANTATTPTNDYGMTFPVDEWISDYAITKGSWTNQAGGQTSYIELPFRTDFCLNANSANGNAISENGGFTFFSVMEENMYGGTGWGGIFNYARLYEASFSHTTGRTISSSGYFGGPLIFANKYYNRFQWRRPADSGSSGDYAYLVDGNINGTNGEYWGNQTNVIAISIISQETKNVSTNTGNIGAYYKYYAKIKNTSTVKTNNSGTMSFGGSGGSKVDLGYDFARPFFNDSTYGGNGAADVKHVACGFANRPYTNTEVETLRLHLLSKYG